MLPDFVAYSLSPPSSPDLSGAGLTIGMTPYTQTARLFPGCNNLEADSPQLRTNLAGAHQVLQPVHISREFRRSRRASNGGMRHKVYFSLVLALISVESVGIVHGQRLRSNSILDSLQSITVSTTPPSGDLNPYGVAFVPAGFPAGGNIAAGDVLVADFNNSSNLQGTGTTIVSITP